MYELCSEQLSECFCSMWYFLMFQLIRELCHIEGHKGKDYHQLFDVSTNNLKKCSTLNVFHTTQAMNMASLSCLLVCSLSQHNTAEAECWSDGNQHFNRININAIQH